jgi:apolipoprotein N-acyltransferase
MSNRTALALALAHGVLFALAFHPAALFPLAWVCIVPEVVLLRRGTARQAILGTGLGHFLHGLLTIYWLAYTPDWSGPALVKDTMGAGPAPWLGTAAGFGLYGLFFAALARPLARGPLPAVLWLPLLWTGVECLQGKLFFFAFPWMWLGYSQYLLGPLVQTADLGGALFVSFIVAAANGALADIALAPKAARPAALRRSGGAAAGLVLAALVYGLVRPLSIELVPGPRVLAVQPWFPQSVKNETERDPTRRLAVMLDLTTRYGSGKEVDLVLWPETIVPVGPADDGKSDWGALDRSAVVRSWLVEAGRRVPADYLVGSEDMEPRGGEIVEHNSAFLLTRAGAVVGRYDKIFLAPMSEETPFAESWPALHRWLRATFIPPGFVQFERGREAKVFPVGRWNVAPSVCFDITFSAATNEAVRKGADLIANVSNYAWFEDSSELDLARVQSMFRAIETRRAVVSDVNGGITHAVDPLGRITDLVGPGGRRKQVEGALYQETATSRAATLFVALPTDAFAWTCMAAAAALALWCRLAARRAGAGPAAA